MVTAPASKISGGTSIKRVEGGILLFAARAAYVGRRGLRRRLSDAGVRFAQTDHRSGRTNPLQRIAALLITFDYDEPLSCHSGKGS
jgi:hypothetical protein